MRVWCHLKKFLSRVHFKQSAAGFNQQRKAGLADWESSFGHCIQMRMPKSLDLFVPFSHFLCFWGKQKCYSISFPCIHPPPLGSEDLLYCSLLKLLNISSTCKVYKALTICWLGRLARHHLTVIFSQTGTRIIFKEVELWSMTGASDCCDISITVFGKIFIIVLCIPVNLPTVALTLTGKNNFGWYR